MSEVGAGDDEGSCNCTSAGRRDFLLDVLRVGATALAVIGIAPSAESMPLRFMTSVGGSAGEKMYAIPAADGVQIDKDAEVILSRVGKQVYAFALACPHQNTALRWEKDDNRFQCPKHKSRYRADGSFIEGRATRSMDRLAIRIAGTALVIDPDKLVQEDMDKNLWQATMVTLP